MRRTIRIAALAVGLVVADGAAAQSGLGTEEFGLTGRQLSQNVERSEASIARCMRGSVSIRPRISRRP